MIVITDSLVHFHKANKITNQNDYSNFMKNKSPDSLAQWNSKATGLYFNQFVKIDLGTISCFKDRRYDLIALFSGANLTETP